MCHNNNPLTPTNMHKLLILILALSLPLHASTTASAIEICTQIPTTLEITELYPAPIDTETEWAKLTNTGSDQIDLSHFTLEDTTEKPFQLSGTISPGDSVQFEDLPFQLNNGGDTVTLKLSDGTVIDSLSYTETLPGEAIPLQESEVVLTETPTESETQTETPVILTEWPIFSEALPNPAGSDSTDEWIELYNPYTYNLPLNGLKLDDADGGSSPYSLEGEIDAESYAVISIEDSNLTLNNGTDSVRLIQNDDVLWEVTYEDPEEDESYSRFGENFAWTNNSTPGMPNESSSNPEDSESEYEDGDLSEEIDITEIFPNPEGPDQDEEWIEITNGGDIEVNLGNWTIDDGEGGSDPYVFPDDTVIQPGETILLYRTETEVALNNSDETVQIIDYIGEIIDEVSYETSEEGRSYAEIEVEEMASTLASTSGLGTKVFQTWQWSLPSPGEENPRWKQFKGEVLSFEEGLLSLFDGINTWDFKTDSTAVDNLVFQVGNSILVRASIAEGFYQIMQSELLKSAKSEESKSLPWGFIGTAILATGWIAYEGYKKRKKLVDF
jgi:hypothetical protein